MLRSGERQVAERINGIRKDHVARYLFAKSYLKPNDRILDAMCGIGYGSRLLSESNFVEAFDIDEETIEFAKSRYYNEKITYECCSYKGFYYHPNLYDLIVCFEAIEHIDDEKFLLSKFHLALKDSGKLILSTPNQLIMPLNPIKHPEHIKHYTPHELESLLNLMGFKVDEWFCQRSKYDSDIMKGHAGLFMIAVCTKL